MSLIIILLALSGPLAAQRNLQSLEGLTFAKPGPNCFGVAMYANDNIRTIRGVDLAEFKAFIPEFCEAVEVPKPGDIGTFQSGDEFIHAFLYLGDDLVLEKTGVDYVGKTPIHIRNIAHTIYTFEASPECRRYGGGSRECYNQLQYFRCQKGLEEGERELSLLEEKIEKNFYDILEGGVPYSARLDLLHSLLERYEEALNVSGASALTLGRLTSYKKQILFFK